MFFVIIFHVVQDIDYIRLTEKTLILHTEQMNDLDYLVRFCKYLSNLSEYTH
jgi:hypothetical protein